MTVEVKLIKKMGYERISCTCGMAVLPKDPTPQITRMVKEIAIKYGARFSIIDLWDHPELMEEYNISELPAVIIEKNAYRVDENVIREALSILK